MKVAFPRLDSITTINFFTVKCFGKDYQKLEKLNEVFCKFFSKPTIYNTANWYGSTKLFISIIGRDRVAMITTKKDVIAVNLGSC